MHFDSVLVLKIKTNIKAKRVFANRPYLQPSLRNINIQTSSCERIGVVGRTGAGKSSLIAALMRISPLHSGRITIDTVDISTLPLSVLRSRISLVPQDSFLFSGTIRDNLDPRGLHLGLYPLSISFFLQLTFLRNFP